MTIYMTSDLHVDHYINHRVSLENYINSVLKPADVLCVAGDTCDDQNLFVEFSTVETRLFDVTSLLDKGSAFAPLSKEENHRTAKVTHGFVSWLDGEIDIAPETLYSESYKYSKEDYTF